MKKIVIISKITIALLLIASFSFSPLAASLVLPASAAPGDPATPTPTSKITHQFTAKDNQTITDTAGKDLTFFYYAPNSVINNKIRYFNDMLMYSIAGISKAGTEYYVGIDAKEFIYQNVFKLDRGNNTFSVMDVNEVNNLPTSTLSAADKDYLTSMSASFWTWPKGVAGMAPKDAPDSTSKIALNCPVTVNYDDSTGVYKKLDVAPTPVNSTSSTTGGGKYYAPKGARLFLYYRSPGSPIYVLDSHYDVGDLGVITVNKNNLKVGDYWLTGGWALKKIADSSTPNDLVNYKSAQINLLSNNSSANDFMTEIYRATVPQPQNLKETVWQAINTISPLVSVWWFENNKKDLSFEMYDLTHSFSIPGNGDLTTCTDLVAKHDVQRDTVDKASKNDDCGPINSSYIMQWAFCEMLLAVRWLANWSYTGAVKIFTSMTNISGVAVDTSGTLDTGSKEGSAAQDSTSSDKSASSGTNTTSPVSGGSTGSGPGGSGTSTEPTSVLQKAKDTCLVLKNFNTASSWGSIQCLTPNVLKDLIQDTKTGTVYSASVYHNEAWKGVDFCHISTNFISVNDDCTQATAY